MNKKILIVDDRPENLLALERVLAETGVEFVRAGSGNEALALTLDNDFALALVDVQMPDMDGYETVELMRLQGKTRYLPVIFISAICNTEDHFIRGLETGAVDFIAKPIVPLLLLGKVKNFLDLHEQKRSLELMVKEREKREKTFKQLAEGLIGGVNDEEVYSYIISTCRTIFNTEHAMVGRLVGDGTVKSCASVVNNDISGSIAYALKGTVCEETISKGVCLYPDGGVQSLFPEDGTLSVMGIESYVGVCLKDSHGKAIGLLKAYSSTPLLLPDYASEVLEIIAGRAAAVIERQIADEARLLLQEQLQQAQKMEAIGTLAGGIAHDFNNILTPIMGFAEMARESVAEDDPLRKDLSQVLEASVRAKELVQQILTFSRQSGQEPRPLYVHLVLKEALKLLRATIPTTITIREDIDQDCGMINADPTKIHQVVMNLCTNAYHSMRKEGGVMTVTLSKAEIQASAPEDQELQSGPGEFIKLKVADTGLGMDKATLDKIFEPYFTTKSQNEGTGLGLAVVHGIVEHCGGAISVFSEQGKGSTFTVYFPKSAEEIPVVEQGTGGGITAGKEHILLVDDDEQIGKMMSAMLERGGYRVSKFMNPVDALDHFVAQPDQFDLVITDMTMPEMTGTQLAKRILDLKTGVPILLCTGYSESTDHELSKSLGIQGYLMKPVSRKDLFLKIRELLDGS